MQEVWFFFKCMEAFLGFLCAIFHIEGFLNAQPLPHQMFFCGTFAGFTFIAIFGNISISIGSPPSVFMEALVSGISSFFFIISSVFSMYHAERDFHLMYLSDYEEEVHPYFAINKKQSITALVNGLLYMLHTIFAVDALIITEESFEKAQIDPSIGPDIECYQPIKLYICGKTIHDYLLNKIWFQKLVGLYDVKTTSDDKKDTPDDVKIISDDVKIVPEKPKPKKSKKEHA